MCSTNFLQIKYKAQNVKPQIFFQNWFLFINKVKDRGKLGGGGGVLSEKLGGGVRHASQNPYPIYDKNLRYSLSYLKG